MKNRIAYRVVLTPIVSLLLSTSAFATSLHDAIVDEITSSTIGIDWVANYPTSSNMDENNSGGVATFGLAASIEHYAPYIPNVKIESYSLEGYTFSFVNSSATAYYNIFENRPFQLKVGAGYSLISSGKLGDDKNHIGESSNIKEFEGGAPHIYAGISSYLPIKGLSVYANVQEIIGSELDGRDYQLGVQYEKEIAGLQTVTSIGYQKTDHEICELPSESNVIETDSVQLRIGVRF